MLASSAHHATRAPRAGITTRQAYRSTRTRALDPSKTALVLIEYQNEFTTEGGKLHGAVKEVMESTNMLANTTKMVTQARKKGVSIVHVPIRFSDDYKELPQSDYGILGNVKASGSFKRSDWGGDICEELTPEPTDIVVEGKRGLCAFAYTALDVTLKGKGIQNVVLGGFLTNCCVESTMRSAYDKGYKVFTLKDACAATSQAEHDAAIRYTFPMFSHPITHQEFLAEL